MAEIPSLTEAYTIIILLAPGFLAFRLFIWRASYEFVFNNLQTTLWSLISSVIIFVPFASIWQFQSISDLETRILQYDVITSYFVLAAVIGTGFGEIARLTWRKGVNRGSVWVKFAFDNVGDWVDVHTSQGDVCRGWIKVMSTDEKHRREVELSHPELLQVKKDERRWVEVGDAIVFTEKDISRIVLLKH